MDEVWVEIWLENSLQERERIGGYYTHPVWLSNGLFAEADPMSRYHREGWRAWLIISQLILNHYAWPIMEVDSVVSPHVSQRILPRISTSSDRAITHQLSDGF